MGDVELSVGSISFIVMLWLTMNFIIGWAVGGTLIHGAKYCGFAFISGFILIPFIGIGAVLYLFFAHHLFTYTALLNFVGLKPNLWLAIVFWLDVIGGVVFTSAIILFLRWLLR
ncbi:hypothetical protein [Candidatus Borrarchaeum sp.]|uniref:hypothetical protein n=1 Tax=Candidatus Borrarchaeum sp. TaxID=2846742 RepID=UPI00257B8C06|nr:hypothetical protein [Candidatus Borrarchaeum sp.]